MAVGVLEPMLRSLSVVAAFDVPLRLKLEVVLEAAGEAVGGHDTAGEEVARHPVGRVLGRKMVGDILVREDVEEQLTAGFKPAGDAAHELAPVLHVLEHLDRHHAVEARSLGGEDVHIAGDDPDVLEAALRAFEFDVGALGGRVRDAGDAGVRIFIGHPERERTPAAAELEDLVAVPEFGARARAGQHGLLGFADGFIAERVIAAGIFEPRAEAELIERRGHLVMLFIRRLRLDGHRQRAQLSRKGVDLSEACRRGLRTFVREARPEQTADAPADDAVGQDVLFDEGIDERHTHTLHEDRAAGNPPRWKINGGADGARRPARVLGSRRRQDPSTSGAAAP